VTHLEVERMVTAVAALLGGQLRDERLRRRWTIRELAARAGVSSTHVQWMESGHAASLEAYVRVSTALGLRLDPRLVDPRRRASVRPQDDLVHAAMGEVLAGRLEPFGLPVAMDEPFQHYQFAGRADLLSWSVERRALLHVENRTRFPNLQETFGSFNTKRRYLPTVLAERLGIRGGWLSVTHVMAALWSAEVLHTIRRHRASFAAVCPDDAAAFRAWLEGSPPNAGESSTLLLIDPVARPRQRLFVDGEAVMQAARPRYAGYADAARALGRRD
jgi:transcriptional regulator with XRE-family HTH domain